MKFSDLFHKKKHSGYKGDNYAGPICTDTLRRIFSGCSDFECREIYAGGKPVKGLSVCYVDGLVNTELLSEAVIRPLTEAGRLAGTRSARECLELSKHGAIYDCSVKERTDINEVVFDILSGLCAVVFDNERTALCFETRTTFWRSISSPEVDKSIKGAKDAFIEAIRINTSLVRRRMKTPSLKIENVDVRFQARCSVALVYLDGKVSEGTVAAVRRRLQAIDVDSAPSAGALEEYLTDSSPLPFPQLLFTERPDKFCLGLISGRVGILIDGLPTGFLFPVTLTQLMKVSEDNSQHYVVSTALMLLRYAAVVLSVLLPAVYVAVAMYHQEMVPMKLLASIIEAKQHVPFSTAAEILGMLLAFELLQEAGLRLPSTVGQTVSIIGALIVGQSAVEAKVISQIAVIVVALAGIAGFAMPNQDLSAAFRLCRFGLVFAAILAGAFGVAAGVTLIIYLLCTIEHMGVAYMSPLADGSGKSLFSGLTRPPLRGREDRS